MKLHFVNRQRGSGTRVLLDYEIRKRGIDPESIQGYEREEFTHLAVAAAVKSGAADTGLGVRAAANALGLDFVPIGRERYDLVVPREHFDDAVLEPLKALLSPPDTALLEDIQLLGGYDTSETGQLRSSKIGEE